MSNGVYNEKILNGLEYKKVDKSRFFSSLDISQCF
jgi:hypothetical protein